MNVLWFTWKDRFHPNAGGAETVSGQLMDHLVRDGHAVKVITALYPGSSSFNSVDGIDFYRTGNRYTVYSKAKSLFQSKLAAWPDLIIDEMNTIPFGTGSYSSTNSILFTYQLAREVWLHQITFPLSLIGYLAEPLMLRWLAKKYPLVVTESESTKKDLHHYGFRGIRTFRVGIALEPLTELDDKKNSNTVLSLGAIRPMKQTLDAIKAFEVAKDKNRALKMVVAGDDSGPYANKIKTYVKKSRYSDDITILGRVSAAKRIELMRDAMIIIVTSIKEGWGLIVTEAASQGTPAIVYDTDGLRDSVRDGRTGIVIENGNTNKMGTQINELLKNPTLYNRLRNSGWEWSKEFTFDNSYRDFLKTIKEYL